MDQFQNSRNQDSDGDSYNYPGNSMATPLLQQMGLPSSSSDATSALPNWPTVSKLLQQHPHYANMPHWDYGISYPLHLALRNAKHPCPAYVITDFLRAHPPSLTVATISNVCRYPHSTGHTIMALFQQQPQLTQSIERWDIDHIGTNGNKHLAQTLIQHNCSKCIPRTIHDWEEFIRGDLHAFWLQCLLDARHCCVGFDHVYQMRLLEHWITNGNVQACKVLLDAYPSLIANELPEECHNEASSGAPFVSRVDLPIHTAFQVTDDKQYSPWHNRSCIVKLLIQRGLEYADYTPEEIQELEEKQEQDRARVVVAPAVATSTVTNSTYVAAFSPSRLSPRAQRRNRHQQEQIQQNRLHHHQQQQQQLQQQSPSMRKRDEMRKTCGGLFMNDSRGQTVLRLALRVLESNVRYNDEERKECLKVCLQFAHASMNVIIHDANNEEGGEEENNDGNNNHEGDEHVNNEQHQQQLLQQRQHDRNMMSRMAELGRQFIGNDDMGGPMVAGPDEDELFMMFHEEQWDDPREVMQQVRQQVHQRRRLHRKQSSSSSEPKIFSIVMQMNQCLNLQMPILHAAIGIVVIEDIKKIIELFDIDVTEDLLLPPSMSSDGKKKKGKKQETEKAEKDEHIMNFQLSHPEGHDFNDNRNESTTPKGKNPLFTLINVFALSKNPNKNIPICVEEFSNDQIREQAALYRHVFNQRFRIQQQGQQGNNIENNINNANQVGVLAAAAEQAPGIFINNQNDQNQFPPPRIAIVHNPPNQLQQGEDRGNVARVVMNPVGINDREHVDIGPPNENNAGFRGLDNHRLLMNMYPQHLIRGEPFPGAQRWGRRGVLPDAERAVRQQLQQDDQVQNANAARPAALDRSLFHRRRRRRHALVEADDRSFEQGEERHLWKVELEYMKGLCGILLKNRTKKIAPSAYPNRRHGLGVNNQQGRNTTYNCAHLKDEDGRLPLHLAAEMGVVESEGLREIIDANVDAVQEPDGLTGLFPFALARGDLNTCFSVLLQNPAVMDDVTRRL